MGEGEKTSIYRYLDYRDYLRDAIEEQRLQNPKFSYRYFNMRAGLKSPSHVHMIMEGKANVGRKSAYRLCKGLGLSEKEARFFEKLINFTQAKTHQDKDAFYNELRKCYPPKEPGMLGEAHYKLFEQWYYPVILEMTRLQHFREIPSWISRKLKPRVPEHKVKKALQELESMGLLERTAAGTLVQSQASFVTPEAVESLAVINFNQQIAQHAASAVRDDAVSRKEFSTITAAMSDQKFAQVKAKLQQYRDELLDFIEADDNDTDPKISVSHINLQLFQLTREKTR
jgi:uncharacterized protein (TIGR02147 family)